MLFLRRGLIENYYRETADIGAGKPDRAALGISWVRC